MPRNYIKEIEETLVRGKSLGRHIHHDPRSRDYRAPVAGLPTQTKVWTRHARVFNQGQLGSCTGNAVAGLASSDPVWVRGRHYTERLAIKVYERATQLDPWPGQYPPDDTGSTGLAACKAIVEFGYATKYLWGFGINDMIGILSNLGPCAVGTNWYEGFDKPDQNGLVTIAGQVRGGHEYEILGWHQDTSLGAPQANVFEAQNSWGAGWGVRGTDSGAGRFFIPLADMTRLLSERGDCVTLSTQ